MIWFIWNISGGMLKKTLNITGGSLRLSQCFLQQREESMRSDWGDIIRQFAGVTWLVLLVVLTILGNAGNVLALEPSRGGTVTVGVDLEFRGFDPLKTVYLQSGDRNVIMAIEERLFGMDRKGKLVPELALSAIPSEDGKSWTIRLRQGVSFHDGTPFKADAVVEHWQRILATENRYSGTIYIEPVQSVIKIDDYTIKFTLKHPWAAFLPMLSSTQWAGAFIPSPDGVRKNTQHRAPTGTGPFIFKEWLANDRLVVVRNPKYWRKGMPFLDSVTFRPVPDIEARLSGLLSGGTDIALTDRGAHILKARKNRALKVYSADTSGPYAFIMNTDRAPLEDARVRRALAHAWNQGQYLKSDHQGSIPMARDPFGGTLSCGECGYRDYDPARSRQLLAEYGKPVALELLETDTPRGRESGKLIQRLFKDIGVSLKLTLLPETQLVKRVMDGDYEISSWRLMDLGDMGPYLNVCLHSKGRLNFSQYRNPAMDELLATQQQSNDQMTRQKALCGIASLINNDAVYLYGGGRRFYAIAKSSVQSLDNFDHGIIPLSKVWVKVKGKKVEKEKKARKSK
jgi:4-phytase/acid phosphatase/peptide/nickel transport system substrate-binding protein